MSRTDQHRSLLLAATVCCSMASAAQLCCCPAGMQVSAPHLQQVAAPALLGLEVLGQPAGILQQQPHNVRIAA